MEGADLCRARHGDTLFVSGFLPFDPKTSEVVDAPIER
jgi:2-iminobutanoate/2-iminopropanoate deaminase